LNRDIQHPAAPNLLRPPIAFKVGTGILTRFPSATAFALTLWADSPCADERCAGNLGLSATALFTLFIATHVSIRTSDTSSNPLGSPSQAYGTLSYRAHTSLKPARHQRIDPAHRADSTLLGRFVGSFAKAKDPTSFSLRSTGAGLNEVCAPAASVTRLSPVTSSAQDDSTSELLRFL
jgi:hypothetical protein